jgi:hypothetical protein
MGHFCRRFIRQRNKRRGQLTVRRNARPERAKFILNEYLFRQRKCGLRRFLFVKPKALELPCARGNKLDHGGLSRIVRSLRGNDRDNFDICPRRSARVFEHLRTRALKPSDEGPSHDASLGRLEQSERHSGRPHQLERDRLLAVWRLGARGHRQELRELLVGARRTDRKRIRRRAGPDGRSAAPRIQVRR